ncbi:hypothetical protein [Streptosporangium lutulentum]|uniref:Uncharacterized protein n=1 Tax=Streptosporangium lutulentum TaxID=1461250 RepID=A0ABT9QDJ1_9ACTN|nr:hypothetical protein [Streptosporangium lutulentum]MDP9844431.1 hypothetical protein [Streptosporangium lutulentum]
MNGMGHGSPAEDQWDLLVSHGFGTRFSGLWVEGDDPDEIARRLRADPESRLECDLPTAMRWYQPYSSTEIVWIGAHAPGWMHVLSISGSYLEEYVLTVGGRRLFRVEYDRLVDGVHDLDYFHNGRFVEELSGFCEGEMETGSIFDLYSMGLDFSHPGDERMMSTFLTLVGRVSGRFIDRRWLEATRVLYRIPDDAWD